MPVSRLTAEGLAEQVAAIYGGVEVRLLRLIAQQLAEGHGSASWAERKLAELQVFRRRAEREAAQAQATALVKLGDALRTAYLRGAAAGQGDAEALGIAADEVPHHGVRAIEALVRAQAGELAGLTLQIVRSATDAYRDAVVKSAAGTLSGAFTRLEDTQAALDDMARRGLTGFTDKAGRRWSLRSYVEMAVRSTTAQAAVQGHIDRLEQVGVPLFVVSDSSRECPKCRPWEGKVLSRGPVAAIMRNALTGKMEPVRVDGTVEQATRAGLFHPNCTHNLSGYVPGATKLGATSNPKGYEERQRQRALERNVRAWKSREAVAVTPEAKAKARARVRAWQAELAKHVETTGLPRKRNRESVSATR